MRSFLFLRTATPRPSRSPLRLSSSLYPFSLSQFSTLPIPPFHPDSAPSIAAAAEKIVRFSSKNVLFDVNLFTQTPEIIQSHLLSRREDATVAMESIEEINQLQKVRVERIRSGNQMKQERKQLSQLIGQHIKRKSAMGTEEEDQESKRINQLRKSVELLKSQILESDKAIAELESSIESLMLKMPNLLDDR
jgi:hypothetical protein